MYFNAQHQQNKSVLDREFPTNHARADIVSYILSVPSIFEAYEPFLAEGYFPIDFVVLYLDEDEKMEHVTLSLSDEMLVKLSLELFNGTREIKKGTFCLYESVNVWNDEYMRLFCHTLQMARPNPIIF